VVGRYVVGVDGTRPSHIARAWAEVRAAHRGVECVSIHVDQPGTDESTAESHRLPEWADAVVWAPGVMPGALIGFVKPGDVLVIGTGKTGFIHGRVFGSLSIQIATLASSDVAVIPDLDVRFRSGVVAGIDRHDTAGLIARSAAEESARLGAPLQLLQSEPAAARRISDGVDLAVAEAELTVRAGWPELEVRTRVVARPAAEALLDAARNAALLVLGPGNPGDEARLTGRVLHDVLINVNAPVLIARG